MISSKFFHREPESPAPATLNGLGVYVDGLSRALARKGHDVMVLTRSRETKYREELLEGVMVVRCPYLKLYPFHIQLHGIFVERLLNSMKSDFDVTHLHSPFVPVIRKRTPTILTLHSTVRGMTPLVRGLGVRSLASRLFGFFYSSLEEKVMSNSDLVTVVSQHVAQDVRRFYRKRGKIVVVGNGVDTSLFKPNEKDDHNHIVLYTGRLEVSKGVYELVRSAALVLRHDPTAIFVLIGDGPCRHDLEKLVARLNLTDRFHFIHKPTFNCLLQYYRSAFVYVLPSYYEGLPTVVLEAMACGVPVVGTKVGGIKEVVEDDETGILVPPKDPESLGKAILNVLSDSTLRNRMGRASRTRVEEKYSWERIADKFLACYEEAISGNLSMVN
jgi:glycosyltransferase involved in cell wall biosynthesis